MRKQNEPFSNFENYGFTKEGAEGKPMTIFGLE
jgi:hypothetical protein